MPLIGITASRKAEKNEPPTASVNETYIQAILFGGGTPLIIPVGLTEDSIAQLCESLDGILFTGGADIDPSLFGGQPHPRVYGVDTQRDHLEIGLVRRCVQQEVPFLAICRGLQVLNVALGGTLYTHIEDQFPDALRHERYPDSPRDHLSHSIKVEKNSHLHRILGCEDLKVNSMHHQGILSIATDLIPVAFSTDQLIEALELPGHPFALGVQWHPEELLSHPPMQSLFKEFIRAAG